MISKFHVYDSVFQPWRTCRIKMLFHEILLTRRCFILFLYSPAILVLSSGSLRIRHSLDGEGGCGREWVNYTKFGNIGTNMGIWIRETAGQRGNVVEFVMWRSTVYFTRWIFTQTFSIACKNMGANFLWSVNWQQGTLRTIGGDIFDHDCLWNDVLSVSSSFFVVSILTSIYEKGLGRRNCSNSRRRITTKHSLRLTSTSLGLPALVSPGSEKTDLILVLSIEPPRTRVV